MNLKPPTPGKSFIVAVLLASIAAAPAEAGILGDLKVYTPVIETGVLEFEYRGGHSFDSDSANNGAEADRFSLGYGVASWWFVEAYANWAKDPGGGLHFDSTEWESVFQLTEPGEYWATFGLLAEYERVANRRADSDEIAIGPLIERDIGATTTDVNLLLSRQIGPVISQGGIGLTYRWQTRWRLMPQFQPGIEAFGELGPVSHILPLREQEHLLGPVIQGRFNLGSIPGTIQYNVGYLFGLTPESPSGALKLIFEYEFPL